jgi:hypothetical protein
MQILSPLCKHKIKNQPRFDYLIFCFSSLSTSTHSQ